MKYINLCILFMALCIPSTALADDNPITDKIEEKLLSRDIEEAKKIVGQLEWNDPIRQQAEPVIDCVEKLLWFYTYLKQQHDVKAAIQAYAPAITSCNDIPDPIPFSEKLARSINTAIDGAEKVVKKECGKDLGEIRVGMKLSRVQKCVGEFELRGQVGSQFGNVDYYYRNGTYLYVKKEKVVAWGN